MYFTMPESYIQTAFDGERFEAEPVNGLLVEVVSRRGEEFSYRTVFWPLAVSGLIDGTPPRLGHNSDPETRDLTRLFLFVPTGNTSLEDLRSAVKELLRKSGVEDKTAKI